MIKLKPLLFSLFISWGIGGIAAFLTNDSMDIYSSIKLPKLAPPSIVFPIAWSILYTLMGISAYMIYESQLERKSFALGIYALQLIVNFLWPLIFFDGRMFLAALICLIILWVLVLWMIISFYKIKPLAAYLQIPYLLWLTFAAYLNLNIYLLNR